MDPLEWHPWRPQRVSKNYPQCNRQTAPYPRTLPGGQGFLDLPHTQSWLQRTTYCPDGHIPSSNQQNPGQLLCQLSLNCCQPRPLLWEFSVEAWVKLDGSQVHTMILSTTFQQGSSRPIPQKSPPPFGSRTTTIQLICSRISPRSQMIWINSTKIRHLQLSPRSAPSLPGFSLATFSLCWISPSHPLRCSAFILVAPVARPFLKNPYHQLNQTADVVK